MLRRLHKLFACFLILTCLLACNVPIDMPVTSTVAPTMTPLPATPEITSSPSPTLTPTLVEPSATLPEPTLPPPTLQPQVLRTRYDFQVEFYPNTHLADIHEQITYINDTGTSMQELTLVVPPNSYENVFTLNGLELANGDLLENYQLNGQTLTIALPAALDAGAQIEVVLRYRLELPPAYGPFGYTSRQNNFGDWYPYVAARDSQNKPLIYARDTVGDNTVQDPADYHVEVELKEDGDWLLAGSSIPQQQDSRMVFDLQAARSFGWSAGLDMIVIHQVEGGVDYRAVIYREHEAAGQEVLFTLFKAGSLYSRLFGPYPHASLTMIETYLPDGMEYDGMFFLGAKFFSAYSGKVTDNLITLTAHEVAHQWWYGLVGNDQALEPWLDESLCTYSELLFYENVYPDLVNWWWQFRVDYFKPGGAVNIPITTYPDFREYVNAVYLRGAHFIHDIRRKVGDEAFFAFFPEYVRRYSGKRVTGDDFFLTMAVVSRENLSDIINRYFQ